jgi:hypothetical protein
MTPDRACIDRHCGVFKLLVHGWQRRGSVSPSLSSIARTPISLRSGRLDAGQRFNRCSTAHSRRHCPSHRLFAERSAPTNSP